MPVIGVLNPASLDTFADELRAFHRGLKEGGHVEGDNVAVVYRWADNQFDRLPALAADLVQRQVAVIATIAGGALAAKAATTTIPIVFITGEDPVRRGLVVSLARPGGNLTEINFFSAELAAKRLELLRELVPAATRLAVLVNPAGPAAERALRDVEPAARAMGLQIQVHNASSSLEINAVFANLARERPDAFFVASDPLFSSRRAQLVNLASRHAMPATFASRDFAIAGIAPECEAEGAPPIVRDLGHEGLALWRAMYPGLVANGTLVVAPARDAADLARFARMTDQHDCRCGAHCGARPESRDASSEASIIPARPTSTP